MKKEQEKHLQEKQSMAEILFFVRHLLMIVNTKHKLLFCPIMLRPIKHSQSVKRYLTGCEGVQVEMIYNIKMILFINI